MSKTGSGWDTLSSTIEYDNPWIRVSHNIVTAPTGKEGIYGKVHFKNRAIAILPIDAQGNTWLVGQNRYTLNQYSWEVPEGGALLDESPLNAAQRELREETGIIAGQWTSLLQTHMSNSVTDEYAVAFVAQQLTFAQTEPDDTEAIDVRKLPLDEAITMVMDGAITDSLSMVSLLKLKLMIDNGELKLK